MKEPTSGTQTRVVNRFVHLVFTKFNVKISFGGNKSPDEEWLRHRFMLFDEFCYPSFRAQTNQNFRWIVFFDTDTPECFKSKIDEYAQWENFLPYFVQSYDQLDLRAVVSENLPSNVPFLITTRVDNDDALSSDFIRKIQDCFSGQDFEFINFPHGLIFSEDKLYLKEDPASHFISLIEKSDRFTTVMVAQHQELGSVGSIRQIESEPVWLEVVHGRNAGNRVGARKRIPLSNLGDRFTIRHPVHPCSESMLSLRAENLSHSLRRMIPTGLKDPLLRLWLALKHR